jgi:hypothetical protein
MDQRPKNDPSNAFPKVRFLNGKTIPPIVRFLNGLTGNSGPGDPAFERPDYRSIQRGKYPNDVRLSFRLDHALQARDKLLQDSSGIRARQGQQLVGDRDFVPAGEMARAL